MTPGAAAGFACIVVSLLMGLWMAHVRERPVYERPAVLIRPLFWRVFRPARWILFLAGWLLLARGWPAGAAGLAILLAVLWGYRRYLASPRHRARMIRRAFDAEKARDPAATDQQVLQRILYSLHGRWGPELIEQIVADNPTPERVAEMVVRMERGFLPAGFHPSRLHRGGR
jgi:hypothetical protein